MNSTFELMQKRTIPILISLMSLALLGIIFIQYRWIDRAIKEKQELIDNNVYQAVNQVEQQLNDHRALKFVSGMSLSKDDTDNCVTTEECLNVNPVQDAFYTGENDSFVQMEIKVVTSNESEIWHDNEQVVHRRFERHYDGQMDSIEIVEIEQGLGDVKSLINRIQLEFLDEHDLRIDSANVENLLSDELRINGLGEIRHWGIWDNKESNYTFQPSKMRMEYGIPMFTTDIVFPGRYELRFSLYNDKIIWNGIWAMILLSLLFILIISTVFAYSIRLVVKHKKISQIKSDFINNMSHEFKTPLASITLAADSLTHPNTELNPKNVQKYVNIIQAEKRKLNNHVERILEVATLNKSAFTIPLETVNLKNMVENVIQKYQLQVEQEMMVINYHGSADVLVSANAFHLESVLANLIDNGLKYSENKAEINIEIDEDKKVISVSDKGIGMDNGQLSKVFDNFYRVQSGDLHTTKGFGLGLSYCKLVIEKMKGEISLQSKLGQGTTAIIQFEKT
jgi:two-component system, OmpR family, phosphate regulon sensor histidine kinase PhoR